MQTSAEAAMSALMTKANYVSGTLTVIAGFTLGEWAALIGIGATIVTCVANLYFRIKSNNRAAHEHELRVRGKRTRLSDIEREN